jgi:Flp pilus assembly protein TadG
LSLPILLALLFGSVELGNYFMNEHTVVKAVRDGARYASRQNFNNYDACAGSVADPVLSNIQTVVKQGLASGGTDLLDWTGATIDVTMSCATTADSDDYGTQTMNGIYADRVNGAPIVTVTASVPYSPVLSSFGFSGFGMTLNASQQAAVMGI